MEKRSFYNQYESKGTKDVQKDRKMSVVTDAYNTSTVEVGGSQVRGHPEAHSEFEAILGYVVKLTLKKKKKE
jgi:hypothetical protein